MTEGIPIRQLNFIKNLLEDAGVQTCRSQPSPMSPAHNFNEWSMRVFRDSGQLYRSQICSLLHLTTKSRPDLNLAFLTLGSYVADRADACGKGVKRVLKYSTVIGNTDQSVKPDEDVQLSGHIGANWGGEAHEKRGSRNVILIRYGNTVLFAASSVQECVSLSSTDAEYVSLFDCCKIIALLWQVLFGPCCPQGHKLLYQDRSRSIEWATGGIVKSFSRGKICTEGITTFWI